VKVSVPQMREAFPPEVFANVQRWMQEHRKRTVTFDHMASRKLYFDEDMRYTAYCNGQASSVQVGGEWNGYQRNDPIGKSIDVPEGTWVVETGFFCGTPVCHVMHWGAPALAVAR